MASVSPPSSPESFQQGEITFLPKTFDMKPEERIGILRDLNNQIEDLDNNINSNTPMLLEPIVEEADRVNQDGTLEEKFKHPEEMVLDSRLLCTTSVIINKCSTNLVRGFSKYDSNEFAEKILQHVKRLSSPETASEGEIQWSLLGKEIMGCFNRTPKLTMLLGTLRPIPKKEVVRRRAVRQAPAPIKKPETVINVGKDEDSVEQTVNTIKKVIHRYIKHNKEPLDFFSLVLHPTNFGKTIENILHTSFLIRDSFIKFKIDKDGIPFLEECTSAEREQCNKPNRKGTADVHNVLPLNMHQWKALVEAYNITEPMIDLDQKKSKNAKE